ncbi:hypothetical protein BZA05DRAFT_390215 [Tricharina praecox]|uniref:uncharacterized protein n=1 Tax=Tricharina praecox TaxID=43433 RepID=UPI0022201AFA|nr:uncharacterized protein BZA05DRAFT_390215 [Tricharina praecox]KAI5855971.1 hypothetical protein BZA05DRAFT_390215 [Tricharina praecox]
MDSTYLLFVLEQVMTVTASAPLTTEIAKYIGREIRRTWCRLKRPFTVWCRSSTDHSVNCFVLGFSLEMETMV